MKYALKSRTKIWIESWIRFKFPEFIYINSSCIEEIIVLFTNQIAHINSNSVIFCQFLVPFQYSVIFDFLELLLRIPPIIFFRKITPWHGALWLARKSGWFTRVILCWPYSCTGCPVFAKLCGSFLYKPFFNDNCIHYPWNFVTSSFWSCFCSIDFLLWF